MNETHRTNGYGSSWQRPTLLAGGPLILLLVTWLWTENTTAIQENKTRLERIERVNQTQSERIATQEEATRNIRESLQRIENGIEELRRTKERGR